MKFRRYDGFRGSVPQKFIDNRVPICPMCGSRNPHWLLDVGRLFEYYLFASYSFQCEKCSCILTVPVVDVVELTDDGEARSLSKKNIGLVRFKIVEVGKMQTTRILEGKEMSLDELNKLATSYLRDLHL
jgi:hypothetical protein